MSNPSAAQIKEIGKAEGQLTIVAWPGYIERGETDKKFDWVTTFEKESGCKVNVKIANTSDEMVALMNEGAYDLVTASGDARLRLVAGKRVQPVDISLSRTRKKSTTPKEAAWYTVDGKSYGVPYQWGANILMYNTEVFKDPPKSWKVVFEEGRCRMANRTRGASRPTTAPSTLQTQRSYLMAHKPDLGIKSPYELTEAQYKASLELLRAQRKLVGRYWHDAFIQIDDFKNEGVVASGSWPFQVNLLKSRKNPTDRISGPGRGCLPGGPTRP